MLRLAQIHNRWLAVQVHAGREFVTASAIRYRGYQEFVPSYEKRCQRFNHEIIKRLPLFAGYVFVRFDVENAQPLITAPGVVRFVGAGDCPTPIEDSEIEALQIATASGRKCGPCLFADAGQQIEIQHGVLAGLKGRLIRWKNKERLIICVNLLRKSVSVERDAYDVVPSVPFAA